MEERRLRSTAAVLITVLLSGCLSVPPGWQPTTASPRAVLLEERPRLIRVQAADGSSMEIKEPTLVGDSIAWLVPVIGRCGEEITPGIPDCTPPQDSMAFFPLSDVRSLEVMGEWETVASKTPTGWRYVLGAVGLIGLILSWPGAT